MSQWRTFLQIRPIIDKGQPNFLHLMAFGDKGRIFFYRKGFFTDKGFTYGYPHPQAMQDPRLKKHARRTWQRMHNCRKC